jgi:hypothetical protein
VSGGVQWEEGGQMKEIKVRVYTVDVLHMLIWNRTKKPLATALSGVRVVFEGERGWGDLTDGQYKPNWNCHYESPV